MSRITRVRGAIDDIYFASRRVVEPIIYLPSFAKPTRRAFNRRAQTEVSRVIEEASYPSDNKGKRGKYPCRGLDIRSALYDCNQRHVHISGVCADVDKGLPLPDGSFEDQITDWGGGPNGNEIPIFADYNGEFLANLMWPSDESAGPSDTYYAQYEQATTSSPRYWKDSTADPRTGSRHLIAEVAAVGEAAAAALLIANIKLCDPVLGFNGGGWVTAVVTPGDTVDIEAYGRVDSVGGGTLNSDFFILWYDSSKTIISAETTTNVSIGTSYAQITGSVVAPANAAYVDVSFSSGNFNGTDPGHTSDYYLDDIAVTVT